MDSKVVTRFPPSPTGPLHIGNVRTGLFNFLFAKKNKGQFIVRVEDTDKARSKKEYELAMLDDIAWLGLKKDNPEVWHQSERTEIYKKYLHKLIDEGKAYISKESEGENKEVVRFKNPKQVIVFEDMIRGQISVDTTDLEDFIIARNINDPVYHMAVVVDDFEAGTTHVIRGEDHISNTPRQILIQEAIGAPRPTYAHLPLILAADRSKLSKRKHGEAVSLEYYRKKGYLSEGILNYLALLGWNPGTEQEIFTFDELLERFSFDQVQKSGAVFDETKLKWINQQHLHKLSPEEFESHAREFLTPETLSALDAKGMLPSVIPLMRERVQTFSDITEMDMEGEWRFFAEDPTYNSELLIPKKADREGTVARLIKVEELLSKLHEDKWHDQSIKETLWAYAEEEGRGNVLWPLRFALSGREKSPDPFTIAGIIGKDATRKRISRAIEELTH